MQVRTKATESMQLCDNTRLGDYIDGESIRNTTSNVNNQYRRVMCCAPVSVSCGECAGKSAISWARRLAVPRVSCVACSTVHP